MTRENAKELLPVIQAYAEGKVVQFRRSSGVWSAKGEGLDFSSSPDRYRIKPEEEYRPYKSCDEMIADYEGRYNTLHPIHAMPLIWVRSKHNRNVVSLITDYDFEFHQIWTAGKATSYTMEQLYREYEFLDGSPCGVKE